jgi:hypothetical protein
MPPGVSAQWPSAIHGAINIGNYWTLVPCMISLRFGIALSSTQGIGFSGSLAGKRFPANGKQI